MDLTHLLTPPAYIVMSILPRMAVLGLELLFQSLHHTPVKLHVITHLDMGVHRPTHKVDIGPVKLCLLITLHRVPMTHPISPIALARLCLDRHTIRLIPVPTPIGQAIAPVPLPQRRLTLPILHPITALAALAHPMAPALLPQTRFIRHTLLQKLDPSHPRLGVPSPL
jgi:hypothetical protein